MNDAEKRFEKVIQFYQSLPDSLLQEVLKRLNINRDLRRSLSKIKSMDKKIERLLLSRTARIPFVDAAYQAIKDKLSIDLSSASYDDIISSITDENKLYVVIFFFRWCYEDSETGVSNDDAYFNTFVDSELFDNILYKRPLNNIGFESENEENSDEESNSVEGDNNGPATIIISTEEVNKVKLIGRIERRNTYYNFFPQYELKDGILTELSPEFLRTEYPSTGGINLAYSFSSASASFLEGLNTDLDRDAFVSNIYIIEIDNYDLEENNNEAYQVKIDLHKLTLNGKNLHNIIKPISLLGIYKVVTCESEPIPDKTLISGNIVINEINLTENELVLLYYDRRYFGPFEVQHRILDDTYYIKTEADEKNYLIPFFSEYDVELLEFEKQVYFENPTVTQLAYIKAEKAKTYDIITNDILIEKISENISLELATTNPEEFDHLCKNSPFLANLPQGIIEQRYARLMEIINNTESFKEKKHEVFESLLKLYQDDSSEASGKIVTSSELYKELQAKYTDVRKRCEYAEQLIQVLQDNLDESNKQKEDLQKNSTGTATPEQIARLEEKIKTLEEELKKSSALITLSENIESLTEKQNELEATTRYLQRQTDEYERKKASIQAEISNAIDTAGSDRLAALTIDPFISGKMMEMAATWGTQEESKQYQSLNAKVLSISPSELKDKALIDFIVSYVQERREYSRNDIINIYISIAQNFITIFSGEPGTGKTSMCNIIAETLGLLEFGEGMNRFVSVSVERGWSSKRDLIGYFNPLTRKYDKANSKIYDALRLLDTEKNESKYPFFIMLDEANLSPIEYYWADFMRLTDRSSINDTYVNIGTEQDLYIPETLRFVATINTDQTTESLSPRLIDRACIIKLPKVEPKIISNTTSASEIITWNSFYHAFSTGTQLNPITHKAIKEIYKLFGDYGMSVSPRIQRCIERYVKTAQVIMEDEADVLAREKALDFAVVQKLLPKINGYYSTYERFFDTLKQLCKEYNLNMTEEAINKIVDSQERNMGYCQYLI